MSSLRNSGAVTESVWTSRAEDFREIPSTSIPTPASRSIETGAGELPITPCTTTRSIHRASFCQSSIRGPWSLWETARFSKLSDAWLEIGRTDLRRFRRALLVGPLKRVICKTLSGLLLRRARLTVARVVARPLSSAVRRSAAAGLFLLRAMVAMRSGAWTSALLAAMALAVALIGPGGWSVEARWFGWRRIDIRSAPKQQTRRSIQLTANPADRECMEVLALLCVQAPDAGNQQCMEGEMLSRNSTAIVGALLCASLMFVASPATSQSFYGSLVSVVRDAQGGVIPGATIVLTNTATSERREGVSAENGEYRFVNLVPGTYRLEVELSGFQRYVRDQIEVNVQSQPRIEVALQLGSLAETVQVTGASPVLQTENASVGIVVGSRPVQELPLNGRNVLNLISLAPSVVPQGGSEGSLTGKNVFAGGNFQIGGGTANQSASYFDGVTVQDSAYGNIVVLTPSPESVAEFRVQTNNSSAEFGRFTGGVINIVSRSGTNSFRGSLFEFHRNKALNSNTFFGERAGLDKPPFVQNNFGGSLGGPVFRDKLFFFGNYEGYRNREGVLFRRTVPTAAMKAGDFSDYRNTATGAVVPIYDPWTQCGINNPGTGGLQRRLRRPGVPNRQQFPGQHHPGRTASVRLQGTS